MVKKILFSKLSSLVFCFSVTACAQNKDTQKTKVTTENKNLTIKKTQNTMDLSKITNPTVKNAIEALQSGDKGVVFFFYRKSCNDG